MAVQRRNGIRSEHAGERVDWRWRWQLRHWGRRDGRKRLPDPLTSPRPVRTTARTLLEGRLREAAELLGVQFDEQIGPRQALLQALDMRIAQREDTLAELQEELERLAAKVDPADPTGPDATGTDLAIRRANRRHRKRFEGTVQRRNALSNALKEDRERWAELVAQIEDLHQRKVAGAHHLRSVYSYAEQIYNRALIKRHPEGDLIRLMLDTSALRLPDWAGRRNDST